VAAYSLCREWEERPMRDQKGQIGNSGLLRESKQDTFDDGSALDCLGRHKIKERAKPGASARPAIDSTIED